MLLFVLLNDSFRNSLSVFQRPSSPVYTVLKSVSIFKSEWTGELLCLSSMRLLTQGMWAEYFSPHKALSYKK